MLSRHNYTNFSLIIQIPQKHNNYSILFYFSNAEAFLLLFCPFTLFVVQPILWSCGPIQVVCYRDHTLPPFQQHLIHHPAWIPSLCVPGADAVKLARALSECVFPLVASLCNCWPYLLRSCGNTSTSNHEVSLLLVHSYIFSALQV